MYKKYYQLGNKGKEGVTYLVENSHGNKCAMKTFRSSKSPSKLKEEYRLLRIAGKAGISPRALDYDKEKKFIVMEKMDQHLYDYLHHNGKRLPRVFQERLIHIFETLDKLEIFHNDANLCNYMLKNNQIYLIDYGMAKPITPELKKKLKSDTPNMTYMLLGFVLKLRELDCPKSSYSILRNKIPKDTLKQLQL